MCLYSVFLKTNIKPFILKLIIHRFNLIPKHPFTIARGTRKLIPNLIVELQHNGISGYGEATANPFYNITTDKLAQQLTKHKSFVEELDLKTSPNDTWQLLATHFKENNFALCALDEAFTDLYTKSKNLKLYEYWQFDIDNIPLTSYTIGIDSIPKMITKIQEKPWPIYKIKLGTSNDLAIIEALREVTDAAFIVDANTGWTVKETLTNAIALKKLGVQFIEQPLKIENWEGAKELYKKSVLPIIADESCQTEEDIDRCKGYFHGVNVKLMKCGGVTPAKRMLEKAKKIGLKTMAGCMTESSIGISAIAHLLPLLDYVDMDGALLLANDPAKGVHIINGKISFSKEYGIGGSLL